MYVQLKKDAEPLISKLSDIEDLLKKHEIKEFFGELLKEQEKYFKNCPSFVKSLGAWGGDFVLTSKFGDYEAYFKKQGFSKIFNWQDLIN